MESSSADIIELYRIRALASYQYLIDKLNLDDMRANWLQSISKVPILFSQVIANSEITCIKDQDKWKSWFLNCSNDTEGSLSLRKELALLLIECCTDIPMGFQQAIQAQVDSVVREFPGGFEESVVNDLYCEDFFQENVRVRGVQERKNYSEYQLLDVVSNKAPPRKRQRSKTEDKYEDDSLRGGKELRSVNSTISGIESNKRGTRSNKISLDSTNPHSEYSTNHMRYITSNSTTDEQTLLDTSCTDLQGSYQLNASYERDPFLMAQFIEKTKCFPCCQSSNFPFLKVNMETFTQLEKSVNSIEKLEDGMHLQPELFDVFSCVPDVPLIFTNDNYLQLDTVERDRLRKWSTDSQVIENCRRLNDVYEMKQQFETYSDGKSSDVGFPEHSISSPILVSTELAADCTRQGFVPQESSWIHQVITQEAEAEKYPPQFEWQIWSSFMCCIFMQIGFTHCSQHALDLMTDILLEKLQKFGKLLCGTRDYDCSLYTEQVNTSREVVWYMKDEVEGDPLQHLFHCLYRSGLIFRIQDLLHYYYTDFPLLSNTIIQVEDAWKERLESLSTTLSSQEEWNQCMDWTSLRNKSCDYYYSESDENNIFGEEGELSEPFRCFGYLGNNHYLDILQLCTVQVPPKMIFASLHTNNLE